MTILLSFIYAYGVFALGVICGFTVGWLACAVLQRTNMFIRRRQEWR